MKGLGLTLLRIVLGVVFIAHGANTLFGTFAGPGIGPGGLQATAAFLASLKMEPSASLAIALGALEFGGGILLVFGALTRWIALALVVSLSVGVWKLHWANGFFLNWTAKNSGEGYEFSLVLIGALLCLALTGAGDLSIDAHQASTAASRAAGKARLRGKM